MVRTTGSNQCLEVLAPPQTDGKPLEALRNARVQQPCDSSEKELLHSLSQHWRVRDAAPEKGRADGLDPCRSPHCAGCYIVDSESGAKIHPPKCGEEYRKWLERWEGRGRIQ